MTQIRKESFAAEKLRTAKQTDSIFVPMDYNYGQNFQGERQKETMFPQGSQKPRKPPVGRDHIPI